MPISTSEPAIQVTYTVTAVVPTSSATVANAVAANTALSASGANVDMVLRQLKLINNPDALYSNATAVATDVNVITTINTTTI